MLDAGFFRGWARFYKLGFRHGRAWVCKYALERERRMGSRSAVMDSGTISHDAMHPREEGGASLKLMQIAKGQKKTILQGVFRIFFIAKHSSGDLLKFWKAHSEQFIHFRFRHVDGQEPVANNTGRRCGI